MLYFYVSVKTMIVNICKTICAYARNSPSCNIISKCI